jgi:ABC-type transport system involved in cytochrome c biogenesis permease component
LEIVGWLVLAGYAFASVGSFVGELIVGVDFGTALVTAIIGPLALPGIVVAVGISGNGHNFSLWIMVTSALLFDCGIAYLLFKAWKMRRNRIVSGPSTPDDRSAYHSS